MDAIIVAIIGAIEGVGVAIIGLMVARSNRKSEEYRNQRAERDKAQDERDKLREERDASLYDLVFASASGTEVLLHQAHGEQLNGNVDEALRQIQAAKAECNHVFNRQAAKL